MIETIRLIESWLMPPGGVLLLLTLALLLAGWLRRTAWFLVFVAVVILYLLSTPWLKFQLAEALEVVPPLQQLPQIDEDQLAAIVVLGGGRDTAAPEYKVNSPEGEREGVLGYGRDVVGRSTLQRLRYGAWLNKKSGFPLLVTGGTPLNEALPESQLMADSLWQDFGISEVWQENQSVNTWEHAQYVPHLLKRQGVTTMLLVTHASHMPRSLRVFQQSPEMEGIRVVAAPTAFTTRGAMDHGFGNWRPSAGALSKNVSFLHEWGGVIWYQIRYGERV